MESNKKIGRPSIYSDEELEFINDNYDKMTYKELTDEINKFAKIKKTEKQIRTKSALIGNRKQYCELNENYFESIDTQEKAYWIGFLYADGYLCRCNTEIGIELMASDEPHLIKFSNCINWTGKIFHRNRHMKIVNNKYYSDTSTCVIRVYSAKMKADLIRNGVSESKTYSNIFPSVSKELFYHFLRGYIDGDGCICIDKNGTISIHITSFHPFAFYEYSKVLNEDGFKTAIYKENDRKYRLYICGGQKLVKKFLNRLYENANIFLDRKYDIYKTCLGIQ